MTGERLEIVHGAAGSPRVIDVTDPDEWVAMRDRAADAMAAHMWGPPHWYRGAASRALAAALHLGALDVEAVERAYEDRLEREADERERLEGLR